MGNPNRLDNHVTNLEQVWKAMGPLLKDSSTLTPNIYDRLMELSVEIGQAAAKKRVDTANWQPGGSAS
jgi:hypothetical protein